MGIDIQWIIKLIFTKWSYILSNENLGYLKMPCKCLQNGETNWQVVSTKYVDGAQLTEQ